MGAVALYVVAGRAVRDALRKVRAERAFDRRREWYEGTMSAVSEYYHDVTLYWQNLSGLGGLGTPLSAELHNNAVRSAAAVTRLTSGARLYADADAIAALDLLHGDTTYILAVLLHLDSTKRADSVGHLRQRVRHTIDVLTTGYRREMGYPALRPTLSDAERKALDEWRAPVLNLGWF